MIIAIDISQIVYATGVSRYTKELVKNLLAIDKQNTYKLFAGVNKQKQAIQDYLAQLDHLKLTYAPYVKFFPPRVADIVWNQFHFWPIDRFIGKCDLVHTSNWAQPPSQAKKISTVHDLTPLLIPQEHTPQVIHNYQRNLAWISKECDAVIAVSWITKKDLLNHSKVSEDKIKVIYSGIEDKFQLVDNALITKVRQKYHITQDYLLFVGTLEPRKNLSRVIKAFLKLNHPTLQLVIVGKYGWGQRLDSEKNQTNIISTGFVPDEELPALYSGAKIFLYPSLYEGFGFPILEAMACGCPVVSSNISSLKEIAQDNAKLINPYKTIEIILAIRQLLTQPELRKNYIEKGLKLAKTFSWQKTATQTLDLYQNLIN